MTDFIQNTNWIGNNEEDIKDDLKLVNESIELNDLAYEIIDNSLQTVADFYIENARYVGKAYRPINFFVTLFGILKEQEAIKEATGECKPVYMITKRKSYKLYKCNQVYHLYFFIETFDEVRNKLIELSKNEDNLEKNT